MSKVIDLNTSIYELAAKYPEIIDILSEIGFTDITKPGMISTAGRFMTLQKGAKLKKIPLEKMIKSLESYGYEVKE